MTKMRIQALAADARVRGKALEHSVAVRLSQAEFARLYKVATKQGLRPSTFARVLIVSGLDEIGAAIPRVD